MLSDLSAAFGRRPHIQPPIPMLLHSHYRTLLGLIVVLFCGVATSHAQRGDIRDNGAFFSDTAKAEASRQMAEIGARFKREVVVETFKSVPDDLKQGVNLQDRAAQNRLFEQWALRKARDLKVNGVYILLSKEPSHLQVLVGNETQKSLFQPRDRDALVSAMLAKLRDHKNDAALLEGVGLIATTMKNHVSTRSRAVAQTRQSATTADETPNPWNWVIAAVVGMAVVWIVIGIFRAMSNRGSSPDVAGGGGSSGGGFMTSLIGGMFGAAAGMWLYDQFSGSHNQDRGNDNFDDNESRRRDSDYSSSGDSFSDDSSSGDSGGGDSGGGDF